MRVAHFSDIHLLSLAGVSWLAFAGKRATGGINLLLNRSKNYSERLAHTMIEDIARQRVDHVILSGDVSNLSFRAEFEATRALLSQLGLPASEISVVPGNHDCYTRSARRADDFARVLGPFIEGDPIGGDASRYPFLRLRGELALIALDTSRPSPPLMAVGTVGREQLQRAEALLTHPEVLRCFRLVVLHHPPRSPHVHWHNRLTDAAAFNEMIARVGADLVVHGHLHRQCREAIAGPAGQVPVIGVTSGTWLSPRDPARRARYNIYEIERRALSRVLTRRYDLAAESWVDDEEAYLS